MWESKSQHCSKPRSSAAAALAGISRRAGLTIANRIGSSLLSGDEILAEELERSVDGGRDAGLGIEPELAEWHVAHLLRLARALVGVEHGPRRMHDVVLRGRDEEDRARRHSRDERDRAPLEDLLDRLER